MASAIWTRSDSESSHGRSVPQIIVFSVLMCTQSCCHLSDPLLIALDSGIRCGLRLYGALSAVRDIQSAIAESMSTYVQSCSRPYTRIAGRWLLLAVTVFSFASTVAMYGIFLSGHEYTTTFRGDFGAGSGLVIVFAALFALNVCRPFLSIWFMALIGIPKIVVGDAVLAWRACVIWRWKRAVKITSAFLLFAVFGISYLPFSSISS